MRYQQLPGDKCSSRNRWNTVRFGKLDYTCLKFKTSVTLVQSFVDAILFCIIRVTRLHKNLKNEESCNVSESEAITKTDVMRVRSAWLLWGETSSFESENSLEGALATPVANYVASKALWKCTKIETTPHHHRNGRKIRPTRCAATRRYRVYTK